MHTYADPLVTAVRADYDTVTFADGATFRTVRFVVTLACGHSYPIATHRAPRVGQALGCLDCGIADIRARMRDRRNARRRAARKGAAA